MYVVPRALGLMQVISVPGNGWIPYFLTAATVGVLLLLRWPQAAGGLLLSAGGSALLNTLLKLFIGRPRPTAQQVAVFDNFGFLSFPSGHVTFYVTYFGFLFLLARQHLPDGWRRRTVLLLLALPVILISLSRISLGAHWPSDTLGAYLWSSVWLGFSWEMTQKERNDE
jgi:undecaprenyl-diphosphatase